MRRVPVRAHPRKDLQTGSNRAPASRIRGAARQPGVRPVPDPGGPLGLRLGWLRHARVMSLPTVVFVGPAALSVLAWLGPSVLLPRRLFVGGPLLEALTRLAAGSIVLSLATFTLGLAGAFERGVLIA